jgi:hypothetical protein
MRHSSVFLAGLCVGCGGSGEAPTGPLPAAQVQPACAVVEPATLMEPDDHLVITIGTFRGCDWTTQAGRGTPQPVSHGTAGAGTIKGTRNQ